MNLFCRRLELDTVIPTAEEILIAEKYMREEVLNSEDQRNNNREKMLAKFVLTRPSRQEFIEKGNNAATTILNRYPRLKYMKEAVSLFALQVLIIIFKKLYWFFLDRR